ncbi:MAG: RHS repeat-associated core domain-containing protein [Bacteroidales bacterium]|nr:RHS repeat-associated core domain-containing protein [Bacteroidales bacterium]
MVDAEDTILQRLGYTPYGTPLVCIGNNQTIRFSGNELIPDLYGVLYDFGARVYAPWFSMFFSPDPLAHRHYDISPYSYCSGNPIRFVDPEGKYWVNAEDKKLITRELYSDINSNNAYRYMKLCSDKLIIITLVLLCLCFPCLCRNPRGVYRTESESGQECVLSLEKHHRYTLQTEECGKISTKSNGKWKRISSDALQISDTFAGYAQELSDSVISITTYQKGSPDSIYVMLNVPEAMEDNFIYSCYFLLAENNFTITPGRVLKVPKSFSTSNHDDGNQLRFYGSTTFSIRILSTDVLSRKQLDYELSIDLGSNNCAVVDIEGFPEDLFEREIYANDIVMLHDGYIYWRGMYWKKDGSENPPLVPKISLPHNRDISGTYARSIFYPFDFENLNEQLELTDEGNYVLYSGNWGHFPASDGDCIIRSEGQWNYLSSDIIELNDNIFDLDGCLPEIAASMQTSSFRSPDSLYLNVLFPAFGHDTHLVKCKVNGHGYLMTDNHSLTLAKDSEEYLIELTVFNTDATLLSRNQLMFPVTIGSVFIGKDNRIDIQLDGLTVCRNNRALYQHELITVKRNMIWWKNAYWGKVN